MSLTRSEENYLKTIYYLAEHNMVNSIATNAMADRLKTTPASVSDMIRKLKDKGLVSYEKYQGVSLNEEGRKLALKIIRKHRLWETFLVRKLGFQWDEVHDVAEQLEHVQSVLLIERLDKFLGSPSVDPHGEPIPGSDGTARYLKRIILDNLPVGSESVLVGVKDSQDVFLQYLDKLNLYIGANIRILEKIAFDHSLQIEINQQQRVNISREVSSNLFCSELDKQQGA
jgi:DtxR family transcriptional regulator, Mn-dependent transcriptional regulator